jgi:hypothetical protein
MQSPDYASLYQFLAHTPEGGLRKILTDPQGFNDVYFSLLLKVVRSGDEAHFIQLIEKAEFPKIKFTPNEQKIKESFWAAAHKVFQSRGLVGPAQKVA